MCRTGTGAAVEPATEPLAGRPGRFAAGGNTIARTAVGIAVAALVCFFQAGCITADASTSSRLQKLVTGGYLTASSKNAAFYVETGPRTNDVILINLETKALKKLSSHETRLGYPFLSPDGERLLLVRQDSHTGQSELLSCDITNLSCRRLFATKFSIVDPIEISADKIVYVSSDPGARYDYADNDLWLYETGKEPRPITDVQFHVLTRLSVTSSHIYFSALGPHPGKEVIPKFKPLENASSSIYRLPFDSRTDVVTVPDTQLSPLFVAARSISNSPSVAFDETFAAFLRTDGYRKGGFRFDLVVQNLTTSASRLFESSGIGFSRPVVVGRTVVVNDLLDDRYVIKRLLPDTTSLKTEIEVTDDEIARLPATEIKIENESRCSRESCASP